MSVVEALELPPRQLPAPPAYHKPVLVTTYSHLPDRHTEPGDASMAYFRPGGAPLGSDLRYGYDRRIERDEGLEEHLDGLCDALQRDGGERRGGVITWRGMMTRIMVAPFEKQEGWEMNCVALDGSVYLEQYESPEGKQYSYKPKDNDAWALQSYMGYSYEAFATLGNEEPPPDAPEAWSGDVNTNVQWCNVVRSAIGDIPLYLGGEVDCVRAEPGEPNPGLDYTVELKTNKVINSDRADGVFHKKLLKHWAQSFLLGVPTVDVGFRTEEGILDSRHEFETASIPGIVMETPAPAWHPTPCLHFLYAVLSMLVRNVLPTDPVGQHRHDSDDLSPATLFRLRFTPRRGVELFHLGDVETQDGRWGGMLPVEYVQWRLSNHQDVS